MARCGALILLLLLPITGGASSGTGLPTESSQARPPYLSCSDRSVSDRFDRHFRRGVRRYWPIAHQADWCWFKSQCHTESHLRPEAESPAGAVGLCQLMPAAWSESTRRPQLGRRHPAANVEAGAIYMARMLRMWYAPRTAACRRELAQASYNAGAGHIIESQKRSGGKRCWPEIQPHLITVTGRHSKETTDYVERIKNTYQTLTR